ncbi:hypothetical protein JOM56_014264 [Amanita muscaria]
MLSNQGLYSNSGQLAHKGSHIGPQTYVNYPVNGSSQMQINSYPSPEYLSLIGNAPAEALISSANDAYMRIHTEKNELEQECNQLKQRLQDTERKLALEIERGEMQAQNYERLTKQLISQISTGSGTSNKKPTRTEQRLEALESAFPMAFDVSKEWASSEKEKSDYPDIKYWDELNYNYDEAANDRGSGKFPKKLRFLEDANGRLIPEHRLDDMCAHLLHTFEEIRLLSPHAFASIV